RDRRFALRGRRERWERRIERGEDAVDHAPSVARFGRVVVREDGERVAQMIKRDDRVVDAEDHLRQTPRGIRVVARERQSLAAACDLVADEPDGAAAEPWQTGLRGATVATHVLSKRDDRIDRKSTRLNSSHD